MTAGESGEHAAVGHRAQVVLDRPNGRDKKRATFYTRCIDGCGWMGPERGSHARAHQDASEHERATR